MYGNSPSAPRVWGRLPDPSMPGTARSEARAEEEPSADVDDLPGDPARPFGGEERDDVGDVVGGAQPVERRRSGDEPGQARRLEVRTVGRRARRALPGAVVSGSPPGRGGGG